MSKHQISKEWLTEQLYYAYLDAKKRKQATCDEFKFEMNWMRNLDLLADDILERTYKPSRGVAFIVKKPVIREIFAAPFRDRVVHHFLYNEVADWWDRRLIYNSFSCRKGKGTKFGIERLQKDIRQVSQGYRKETYVIMADIQGYFMSLDRKKLYERICWGLDRQFPKGGVKYKLLKYLWKEIIFDDPVRGVKRRQPISLWKLLPFSKSLFHQPKGKGIVIGNLSSQLLSNIYLDQLDRFVSLELGYKHYGRYVDDFYIVVTKDQLSQAVKDLDAISEYLSGLGLTLHPNKRHIQDVKKGVGFLGVVIYPFGLVPGKRVKMNFYQAVQACAMGKKGPETITSYLGAFKHLKAKKFVKKVFDSVGWDYLW